MVFLIVFLLFLPFLIVGIGAIVYGTILYNELVRLRNDNDRAWANIDVLLKQRHDEIPNLVETVKGYMGHEKETLESVTQARVQSMNAISVGEKAQADTLTTRALQNLFAVAENYPQLKANDNFLRLQSRISELEERIADRREYFNDDVYTYNTRLRQVPEVCIAWLVGLKPRELFKASDNDRTPVKLDLAKQHPAIQ